MRNNFSSLAANLNLKEYGGFVRSPNVVETDHLASKVQHQSCLVERTAEVQTPAEVVSGSGQMLHQKDGAEHVESNPQLVFIPAPSHGKL